MPRMQIVLTYPDDMDYADAAMEAMEALPEWADHIDVDAIRER